MGNISSYSASLSIRSDWHGYKIYCMKNSVLYISIAKNYVYIVYIKGIIDIVCSVNNNA